MFPALGWAGSRLTGLVALWNASSECGFFMFFCLLWFFKEVWRTCLPVSVKITSQKLTVCRPSKEMSSSNPSIFRCKLAGFVSGRFQKKTFLLLWLIFNSSAPFIAYWSCGCHLLIQYCQGTAITINPITAKYCRTTLSSKFFTAKGAQTKATANLRSILI